MRCLYVGGRRLDGGTLDTLARDFRGLRLRYGLGLDGRWRFGRGSGFGRRRRAECLDGDGLGDEGFDLCVGGRVAPPLGRGRLGKGHLGGGRLGRHRLGRHRLGGFDGRLDLGLDAVFRPCFCSGVLDVGAIDPAAPPRFVVFVGFGRQALLLGDQPFAVGDRDLIVVGMDFGEGQEAMAVAAIFHEGRLQ